LLTSSANYTFTNAGSGANTGVLVKNAGFYQVTFGVNPTNGTVPMNNWDLQVNAALFAGNSLACGTLNVSPNLTLILQLAANSTIAIRNNTNAAHTLTSTAGTAVGSPSSVVAYITIVQLL
jgi:hypothetical protein